MLPSATPTSASSPATQRGKLRMVFLNATACYVLAFLVITFVYQAAQVVVARRAGVPGAWGVSGVRFGLADGGWQRDTVLAVYGLGPLLVLGLGTAAFALFWRRQRQRRGLGKLLLLWLAFHALNTVCGGLLADTLTRAGLWYVPMWLFAVGTWPSTVLSLLLGVVQLLLGLLLAVPFLAAQDSRTILQFEHRLHLVRYAILGPWLAGSLLLALSKLPHLSLNEGLHYATMGLLLVPLALGCQQEFSASSQVLPYPTRVAWGLVGLAALGLLAWRWALQSPIAFR